MRNKQFAFVIYVDIDVFFAIWGAIAGGINTAMRSHELQLFINEKI